MVQTISIKRAHGDNSLYTQFQRSAVKSKELCIIKKSGVLIGFLFLLTLVAGFASAQSCSITASASCSGYPVMGISSATNAHGELASEGNYGFVLCCDFGSGDTACTGDNNIIGLSSSTNAHAEVPDGLVYTGNDICYDSVKDCKTDTLGLCWFGDIEILSLSASTNAHIGGFDDYSEGICCEPSTATSAYWADSDKNLISETFVNLGTTEVLLVLEDGDANDPVDFEIFEDDGGGIFDDTITTISSTTDSSGNANVTWLITQSDLENGLGVGDATIYDLEDFYFEVQGETSGTLNITIVTCSGAALCMDYTAQPSCEADACSVADTSVPPSVDCDDSDIDCSCWWGTINSTCGAGWNIIDPEANGTNPSSIGTCLYSEDTNDNCDDGFLTYSWIADWQWDSNNSFNISGGSGYIFNTTGDDMWHYDPNNKSLECVDGFNTIPCPAQIKLPFFDWLNLVIAIALIALVYFVLAKKRKIKYKKRKKKHKK